MLKLDGDEPGISISTPAAFRRLCVETQNGTLYEKTKLSQPPLGGCVLKQPTCPTLPELSCQPPLGGCVLKQGTPQSLESCLCQPPLGGCVLKHEFEIMKSASAESSRL